MPKRRLPEPRLGAAHGGSHQTGSGSFRGRGGEALYMFWRMRIRTEHRRPSAKGLVRGREVPGSTRNRRFFGGRPAGFPTRYHRSLFEGNRLLAARYRRLLVWTDRGNCAACCSLLPRLCEMIRSEEHTSELQSQSNLVCRLLLEKKKKKKKKQKKEK